MRRRLVLAVIALLGLALLYRDAEGRLLEASVWTVPFVLLALLVSWPWRTVSPVTVLLAVALGFGPLFAISVLLQHGLEAMPLGAFLDPFNDPRLQLWAPVTEEFVKLIPLLALLLWRPAGLRGRCGPLDLAVVAGATGAGLGFAEDVLRVAQPLAWELPTSPLFGLGLGRLYLAAVGVDLAVAPAEPAAEFASLAANVLPTVEAVSSAVVWPGHAALPAGVGLALGLALAMVSRARLAVGLAVGVAAYAYAVGVHVTANWYSEARCDGELTLPCVAAGIDLTGRVSTILVVVGWVAATVVSERVLRWHRAVDRELYPPPRELAWRAYGSSGPRGWLAFVADLLTFLRLRRRLAFGAHRFRRADEPGRVRASLPLLATRTRALLLMTRLFGRDAPGVPPEARRVIEVLSPLT